MQNITVKQFTIPLFFLMTNIHFEQSYSISKYANMMVKITRVYELWFSLAFSKCLKHTYKIWHELAGLSVLLLTKLLDIQEWRLSIYINNLFRRNKFEMLSKTCRRTIILRNIIKIQFPQIFERRFPSA